MSGFVKNSLRNQVRMYIIRHGPKTVAETTKAIGHLISFDRAMHEGERMLRVEAGRTRDGWKGLNPSNPIYTPEHLADLGRRSLVRYAVKSLIQFKAIAKVSPGVYGPNPGEGPSRGSLQERIRLYVVEKGTATVAQVCAAIGKYIPAAQAARAGSRIVARELGRRKGMAPRTTYTTAKLIAIARREMVATSLSHLTREGKLSRVAKATYGPPVPKPKLYEPSSPAESA